MTSEERRQGRYLRRVEKREAKRLAYNKPYDDFSTVIDLNHLLHAARMSRKGVFKKTSVQKYNVNLMANVVESRRMLLNGDDVREGFIEFDLNERGKTRHIKAMHVRERVIQRCLCDYALVPVLRRSLVYDNGASLSGKGIHFTLFRLKKMLQKYIRKHGVNGYIALVDFTGYFDNIMHLPIYELLKKNFRDERIRQLTWRFVKAFGTSSLGIGSQVSQIIAISYPSRVDHMIKEKFQNGSSARYMDDSYIIDSCRERLEDTLIECFNEWRKLGIVISDRKSRIVPLRNFTFMKVRYRITNTGKVLMLPNPKSFTVMRRKLRAFKKFLDDGSMTLDQVVCAYQSWYGYQKHFNGYKRLKRMDNYFNSLFESEVCT